MGATFEIGEHYGPKPNPAIIAILQQDNIDERLEPASLTKLMTAYIVFSELKSGRIQLDKRRG
jgi:hypothetical protein